MTIDQRLELILERSLAREGLRLSDACLADIRAQLEDLIDLISTRPTHAQKLFSPVNDGFQVMRLVAAGEWSATKGAQAVRDLLGGKNVDIPATN